MENNQSRVYFYARCSTKNQSLDRQIMLFKQKYNAKDEQIICEKVSGKISATERDGFNYLTNILLREKDTVVIDSLSRLGRNYQDILKSWSKISEIGAYIIVDEMSDILDTRPKSTELDDLINNLTINIVTHFLAFAAQKEVEEKKRAQLQGIEAARKTGKRFGRPAFVVPDNFPDIYDTWKNGEMTATQAMRKLHMSHSTFYRVVKKYEIRKM